MQAGIWNYLSEVFSLKKAYIFLPPKHLLKNITFFVYIQISENDSLLWCKRKTKILLQELMPQILTTTEKVIILTNSKN